MEKNFRFGFHQQLSLSSPNLNSSHFPMDTGHSNAGPVFMNTYSAEDSTLRTFPLVPVSQFQQQRVSELNDSKHGLCSVPSLCPTFGPALNTASKENVLTGLFDFRQHTDPATTGTAHNQKRFLVFDQSGEKTTLVYSSGVQTLVEYGDDWAGNPFTSHVLSKEDPKNSIHPSRVYIADENIEDNSRDVMGDEFHEDTEELDALLCSDSDCDFSVDEEEASTGHSPSTIRDLVEETGTGEEVDSLVGPSKRQKLLDGGFVLSDRHTLSSVKSFMLFPLGDEAESHCSDDSKLCKEELESWSGNKRLRQEKIHDTLSILWSVIPNMNGKDAIVVIDEAIHYLKSLMGEAEALGLNNI